jgi:hypothetical protein
MHSEMDDIPELEDFSEELKKIRGNNHNSDENSEITVKVIESDNPKVTSVIKQPDEGFKFKKGFFRKQQEEKPKEQTKEQLVDLTHIKSNPVEKPKHKLIENVKTEVKSNNNNSNLLGDIMGKKDEWMTPDLLNKIAQKPHLLKYFMDPRFSEAIQLMQKDPNKAKQVYGGNPEFNEFIKEFSSMMADHFNNLGSSNKDIEVDELLQDPKVAYYINILQTTGRLDVDVLQNDPKTFEKIKKLIDKGVLKIQKE